MNLNNILMISLLRIRSLYWNNIKNYYYIQPFYPLKNHKGVFIKYSVNGIRNYTSVEEVQKEYMRKFLR